jgi:glutamine amidotransferase
MDLLAGLEKEKNFYFAHSYYADITDSDVKIAYTNYGFDLPASVQKANIYGTQFHPEKSGQAGLKVLRNFAQICERLTLKC